MLTANKKLLGACMIIPKVDHKSLHSMVSSYHHKKWVSSSHRKFIITSRFSYTTSSYILTKRGHQKSFSPNYNQNVQHHHQVISQLHHLHACIPSPMPSRAPQKVVVFLGNVVPQLEGAVWVVQAHKVGVGDMPKRQ
jgi:hypothetical protein